MIFGYVPLDLGSGFTTDSWRPSLTQEQPIMHQTCISSEAWQDTGSVVHTQRIPLVIFILNTLQWNVLHKHRRLFCFICHRDNAGGADIYSPPTSWGPFLSRHQWTLLAEADSDSGFPLHTAVTQCHKMKSSVESQESKLRPCYSIRNNPNYIFCKKERRPILRVCVCVSGNNYAQTITSRSLMSSFWNISWNEWVIMEWMLFSIDAQWTTLFPLP